MKTKNSKSKSVKTRAVHRIKIIQGHLKKVQQMLEEDAYCVDVVHQTHAIQNALRELDKLIIEEHLNTCVVNQISSGKKKKAVTELLKLFEHK